ncbi:MAG: 4Fe-4S dicluster domain-containing protein [Planctomycetota bacterium]|jgi:carbon-monoxide dehydrogenase iron sulfur subunit
MDKTIAVNIEKCLACRSCEIACALVHSESKVLEEAVNESPKPQRRVTVESVEGFAVPIQCRHCEDAPCITVCPTGAIHRHQANDPVLIDKEKCIGCRFCLMVCPFGVIDITRDGKAVVKCDLCIERTKAGQGPACVTACPTGALKLADEKELAADKRKRTARGLVAATQQDSERDDLEENSQ